jgi:hypothetical protein
MILRIEQNRVHSTFHFLFPDNALKTTAPPFSPPGIPGRQAHNVSMKISIRTARSHPFSSALIHGDHGDDGEVVFEKIKKMSKRTEPKRRKNTEPACRLQLSPKKIFTHEPNKSLITNQPAILRNINR